jgi:hypothetical protein
LSKSRHQADQQVDLRRRENQEGWAKWQLLLLPASSRMLPWATASEVSQTVVLRAEGAH